MKTFLHRRPTHGGEHHPSTGQSPELSAMPGRPRAFPAVSSGAAAIGALAIGALSIGALAIGALAIGRMVIGRLSIKKARIGTLEVGELKVGKLEIVESAGSGVESKERDGE
jgi:hypothetical protein